VHLHTLALAERAWIDDVGMILDVARNIKAIFARGKRQESGNGGGSMIIRQSICTGSAVGLAGASAGFCIVGLLRRGLALIFEGIARCIHLNKRQADGTNLRSQRLIVWVLLQS